MESLKACKATGRPQKQQNTIKPRQNDKNRLRGNATRPHGLDRTRIIIIFIIILLFIIRDRCQPCVEQYLYFIFETLFEKKHNQSTGYASQHKSVPVPSQDKLGGLSGRKGIRCNMGVGGHR